MKWPSIMKGLAAILAVTAITGCASDTGRNPPTDPERAHALAEIRTKLAADYYERKQYAIALEETAKAMRAEPRYAPAYNMRALIHMALLEDSEAEADFREALSLDSANSETHNNYGLFLCQHGREREGIRHFLTAAKDPLYATPGGAYLNAGICSKKIGQSQDAELYLQRAMILQPDLPSPLFEMADLAFTAGDFPKAKANFARYEKMAGTRLTAENLLLAVRIEHKLGNRGAEAGYAARLRKEFPDSRETAMLGQIR